MIKPKVVNKAAQKKEQDVNIILFSINKFIPVQAYLATTIFFLIIPLS
jgi:hypothetical protein